jgi:hypothetical protein
VRRVLEKKPLGVVGKRHRFEEERLRLEEERLRLEEKRLRLEQKRHSFE